MIYSEPDMFQILVTSQQINNICNESVIIVKINEKHVVLALLARNAKINKIEIWQEMRDAEYLYGITFIRSPPRGAASGMSRCSLFG